MVHYVADPGGLAHPRLVGSTDDTSDLDRPAVYPLVRCVRRLPKVIDEVICLLLWVRKPVAFPNCVKPALRHREWSFPSASGTPQRMACYRPPKWFIADELSF